MEGTFSHTEKVEHHSLSRGLLEGVAATLPDYCVQGSNLEQSFSNLSELMNFDQYAGWYDSPINLPDQIFPAFALPSVTTVSTNSSPFDGLNCTHQYNSGISMVDCDILQGHLVGETEVAFNHKDSQFPFATNSTVDEFDLIEMRGKNTTQNNLAVDVGHSSIPRSPMPSLEVKMLRALNLFKEWSGDGILAQMWIPLKNGDRHILSTCEQPYLLDQTLSGYREVSRLFTFAAEAKPNSASGLPGRVFVSMIPEWTSNVMYYNKSEYVRVQYALDHDIRGSIALPVFDEDSRERSCCAVLELVTKKEKPNFDEEMENVCHALQAVKLRSNIPPRLYPQGLSNNQRAALAEITDVLRAVCHAHLLPLALTWIPSYHKEGPGDETTKVHAEGLCADKKNLLYIEDTACYVNDKDMKGFVLACAEHSLTEGQGIAGKALQSNHPFFYPDVKEYHISEYPLVHNARKFGLNAAVAIRLRSLYTGDSDYILEFFLPINMKGSTEQQLLLDNLSNTMQRICKSLRTVSDAELLGMEASRGELHDVERKIAGTALLRRNREQSFINGDLNRKSHANQNISDSTTTGKDSAGLHEQKMNQSKKNIQKKRSVGEKHVSLSVLQQYFSGSLKDAAKSIGVCPTTLKRICRKHGISRWPSRKINKVNRSLKKIQRVLDSVQGVEEAWKFDRSTGAPDTSGSIVRELDSRKSLILSNKNPEIINFDSSRKAKSALAGPGPESDQDIENTILKMEGCMLDGNQVPRQSRTCPLEMMNTREVSRLAASDPRLSMSASVKNAPWSTSPSRWGTFGDHSMKPGSSDFNFISKISSSTAADDTMNTTRNPGSGTDKDGPVCSGTTESTSPSSSGSFDKRHNLKSEMIVGPSIRVKATYKEDTIRFKFEPAVGYLELYEEIAKRFKLHMGQFHLKYLDDEEEWVMLVPDADLQECLEILEFQGTCNVKFLVQDMPCAVGSSSGSNCFLGDGS